MSSRSSRLLLLLALVASGCSRCSREPAAPTGEALLRWLPADAKAVLVVPDAGVLGEKLALLQKLKIASFLAQLQGMPSSEAYLNAAMRQLGVDLRQPDALEQVGLDPKKGVGVVSLPDHRTYVVLGVKDERRVEERFAALAQARLGATEKELRSEKGGRRVAFRRPQGALPELALLFHQGFVWVGNSSSVTELPRGAELPIEKSLLMAPAFKAALERLPAQRDFYALIPGGGGLWPPGEVDALTLVGQLSAEALTVNLDATGAGVKQALLALAPQEGPQLTPWLAPNSVVVARFGGDPAGLAPLLPTLLGTQVMRAAGSTGFDFNTEVLGVLKSGPVAGLSLASNVSLGVGMPALDFRRTNPFRYVQLSAVAEVKDEEKARQTLARIPPLAARFGATFEEADVEGQKAYLSHYNQGEGAHLAQRGNKVVLAAPRARLEEALRALSGAAGKSPLPADVEDAVKKNAFWVVLDLRRLSGEIKALPSQAWGIGGFAIKATVVRWLDAMDDLKAVTLGLSSKGPALQGELSLRLSPAGK